jgi:uncharacterized protein
MEKSVEIKTQRGLLRGMIHYPDRNEERFPVVVIFHGFQDNRMGPESLFVALSRHLARNGFASVRFDFMGSGESEGSFTDLTLSGEMEDALSVIEWTRVQERIDTGRFAFLGHSMGGSLAGMLAGRIAKGAIPGLGIGIKTLILLSPAGEIRDRINDEIARRGIPITIDSPVIGSLPFPVQVGGDLLSKEFFTDMRTYHVLEDTSAYKGPALFIQGKEDRAVPPEVAVQYAAVLPQSERFMIKGARHKFNTPQSRKELCRIITSHLVRHG